MKIAFVGSEVYPFAKTGGLGDVLGSLPKAIQKLGNDVRVFLPKYSVVENDRFDLSYCWNIGEIEVRVYGYTHIVNVYETTLPNSPVMIYFVDHPPFFHRYNLYTNDHDEDERFILFQKAVIQILQKMNWYPDILHCNDWQTGLIPLFLKDNYSWDEKFAKTASVMTIHNIGYQGRFPKESLYKAEINPDLFYENSPIEVWGSVCFLKAGLMYADVITTVSKTYAKEVMTPHFGEGLDGVLRFREDDFCGILNGVDYSVWDASKDKHIPYHYSPDDLGGKYKNKEYLIKYAKLPYREDVPLVGVISRLVEQKGFDVFAAAAYELLSIDVQWIVLGSGEKQFEDFFRALQYSYPDKVYAYIGYSNEMSHLIEAASDIFFMPSRYEPCGLNQIYSLRYGTIPVVRKTGGLADTVRDWDEFAAKGLDTGTGFSFNDLDPYALSSTMSRAVSKYHDKQVWNKIIQNGMKEDFSWELSASGYMEVYKKALAKK
jgi:starch synthase